MAGVGKRMIQMGLTLPQTTPLSGNTPIMLTWLIACNGADIQGEAECFDKMTGSRSRVGRGQNRD